MTPLFAGAYIFKGEFGVTHIESRGSACRLISKAAQQHGFSLPPGFSDEPLTPFFRDRRFYIVILE